MLRKKAKEEESRAGDSVKESSDNKKKKNSFKRIKGFLTGQSRREKKAKKASASNSSKDVPSLGSSVTPSIQVSSEPYKMLPPNPVNADEGDDESTIFGVQVDDNNSITNSLAGQPAATSQPSNQPHVQKNITDSNQESDVSTSVTTESIPDTNKANAPAFILKVVLLLMDPVSRRFELLQLEFDSKKALVSDVLAQIPISVTEAALRDQRFVGICGADAKEMIPSQLLSDFSSGNEVLVAIPSSNTPKECVRLARPILSDEKVSSMLKASGIDFAAWRVVKKSKKKLDPNSQSKQIPSSVPKLRHETNDHSETCISDFVKDQGSINNSLKDTSTNDASYESKNAKKEFLQPHEETIPEVNISTGRTSLVGLVVVALIAFFLQVFHLYISNPIAPGSIVAPGVWLRKCGLFGAITSCEEAFVHISKQGNVEYYNSQNTIAWQMEGAVCKTGDSTCIPGMQFTTDGKIIIGNKPIMYVNKFGLDMPMSPWPFEVEPKVKTWLKNQKATKA